MLFQLLYLADSRRVIPRTLRNGVRHMLRTVRWTVEKRLPVRAAIVVTRYPGLPGPSRGARGVRVNRLYSSLGLPKLIRSPTSMEVAMR